MAAQYHCRRLTLKSNCAHGLARWFVSLLFVMLSISGCSRLQLPAFDPNGSRVFQKDYTPVELPRFHNGNGILPTPAYQTPATPPPCLDGSDGGFCNLLDHRCKLSDHIGRQKPGEQGELLLTPLSVVAPVGGEVVFLAGICGPDGHYVTKQPIEWMLAPDSVGNIIEVGDEERTTIGKLLHHREPKVEKLDGDFARGRTTTKPHVITKGSGDCSDRIPVKEGQTWLTVSSPTSGVTHVTALAPECEIWDQRRQTATIYWVDAQWDFPPPASSRGEPIQLTTRVTKAASMVPATDWRVRYRSLDPNAAVFQTVEGPAAEVIVSVDANGQARATAVPGAAGYGTSPILVDILKPADPDNRLPELRLGGGQTMITFSAPVLVLTALGPEIASPGATLTYNAAIANAGDIDVENSVLSVRIPEGWQVNRVVPDPNTTQAGYLIWNQGILGAGQQLNVQVDFQAGRAGEYQILWEARGEPNLSETKALQTSIVRSSLDVTFEPFGQVAQAEVGDRVEYLVRMTNTGRTPLTDVVALIRMSEGLVHTESGNLEVEKRFPVIEPDQTFELPINFTVRQEGQQQASLEVLAGSVILAQQNASILGLPRRIRNPGVSLEITEFPASMAVGETHDAVIRVANSGEVALSDVQVEFMYDASVELRQVDPVNRSRLSRSTANPRVWTWRSPDLLAPVDSSSPLKYQDLRLQFEAVAPAETGSIQARVLTAQNAQANSGVQFSVRNDPDATGSIGGGARTNQLRVFLLESGDPIQLGRQMSYYLTIQNDRDLADSEVIVDIRRPQGVDIDAITSDRGANISYEVDPQDPSVLHLAEIRSMRPGERLNFTIEVTPRVLQDMTFEVKAASKLQQTPVGDSETTTVTAAAR